MYTVQCTVHVVYYFMFSGAGFYSPKALAVNTRGQVRTLFIISIWSVKVSFLTAHSKKLNKPVLFLELFYFVYTVFARLSEFEPQLGVFIEHYWQSISAYRCSFISIFLLVDYTAYFTL